MRIYSYKQLASVASTGLLYNYLGPILPKSYLWQHFITNFNSGIIYINYIISALVVPVLLITPQAVIITCDI